MRNIFILFNLKNNPFAMFQSYFNIFLKKYSFLNHSKVYRLYFIAKAFVKMKKYIYNLTFCEENKDFSLTFEVE